MVDALSRAQNDDVSTLCEDPLNLQYHPMHCDQAQVSHEVCFETQALGNQEPTHMTQHWGLCTTWQWTMRNIWR